MCRRTMPLLVVTLAVAMAAGPAGAELVGHWRFNDGGGTVARDDSGYANDGTLEGGPAWVAGTLAGALEFDGVDDFVEVPHDNVLTVDQDVTVMAWINAERHTGPGGAGWQGILAKSNSPRSYSLYTNSAGNLHFSTAGAGSESSSPVPLNEWVHVAAQVVDGEHRYFLNGQPAGTAGSGITLPGTADTAPVLIGRTAEADREFLGMIDDTRIYNHALSEIEIQDAMTDVPFPQALPLQPALGALIDRTFFTLEWIPGDFAASHLVYFGESFDAVDAGQVEPVATTTASLRVGMTAPYAAGLSPGQTYYWRIDEVNDLHPESPWKGNVWSFRVRPVTAWAPSPADGLQYLLPGQTLSWEHGVGALFHTVFFGESFDEVNDAVAGGYMTADPTFDPGLLEPGKTYYWRVDEFTAGAVTHKGEVWSFTMLGEVPAADPDLVGWWTLDEGMGALAVDWSGQGNHGTIIADPQWADGYHGGAMAFDSAGQYIDCGAAAENVTGDFTLAAWVQLAPGTAGHYGGIAGKLMRLDGNADYMGFSLVRHSSNVFRLWVGDGDAANIKGSASSNFKYTDTEWHHVAGVREGQTNALYVDGLRQDATNNTGFVPSTQFFHIGRQYSHLDDRYFRGKIDDVRIYAKALTEQGIGQVMRGDPLLAGDPVPGRQEIVDIRDVTSLSWRAGDTAASHDVYVGTDRQAVATADRSAPEYQGNQAATTLSLATLVEFGGGDYYWRIDEVEADGATIHTGYVWTFSVPGYLIVDGFESYREDEGTRIYETWIGGDIDGLSTSLVGYAEEPFAEQSTVHSGSQSMPLDYNNVNTPYYAEAKRTWVTPQNWTTNGVDALRLYVKGQTGNDPAVLYVALTDGTGATAVVRYADDTAVTSKQWIQWSIPLADFAGVNAAAIKTIVVGLGDRDNPTPGGAGLIFIDDIRVVPSEGQ